MIGQEGWLEAVAAGVARLEKQDGLLFQWVMRSWRIAMEREVERVKGIEPSLSAWEAGVMPLYDTRSNG